MKNRLLNLAKLLVSVALLALIFRLIDPRQALASLRGMDWRFYAAAAVLFQLTLFIRSYRWRALLDALDTHVPVRRLLYLYYVGTLFNTFLPSGFGGDAVKMYELNRYSRRPSEAVGTVLVDRLAGIIMLFVMGLVAWPWVRQALPPREGYFLLLVSAGGLVATALFFQRRLMARLLRLLPKFVRSKVEALYTAIYTCGTQALWKALAISTLFNLVLFGVNYYLARALGVRLPLLYFAAFMPILSLSMLIPSVGALGTREGAYILLFGAAGVPQHVALAMSLAFYTINILTGAIGAALYAIVALRDLRTRASRIAAEEKESTDGSIDRRAGL